MIKMLVSQIIRIILGQLIYESERRLRDYNDALSVNKKLQQQMDAGVIEKIELVEPEKPTVIQVVDEQKVIDALMEPFLMLQKALESEEATMMDMPGLRIVTGDAPASAPEPAKAAKTAKKTDTAPQPA